MTTITKILGLVAALSAASSVFAQTAPANPAAEGSSGVLGYRYAEAGFAYLDVNKTNVDGLATGLTVNLPVAPNIDVAFDYAYSWLKSHGGSHASLLDVSGIYYIDSGNGLKPFGGVSLGRTWARHDAQYTWGATAGLEYQVNSKISVTGTINYSDDFKRGNHSGSWDGTATGRYWFTRQIGAFASVSLLEGASYGYAAGVTYKF